MVERDLEEVVAEKIHTIGERFIELEHRMADPEVIKNTSLYRDVSREYNDCRHVLSLKKQQEDVEKEIAEDRKILSEETDDELKEIAQSDLEEKGRQLNEITRELQLALIPEDPEDRRNVIMEIRAGTGGDEAALFSGDLFRMYTKFAERKGWQCEILHSHPTEMGGFKEIVFSVKGKKAFRHFKNESGIHRVQRIPVTESGGRIHTSAVSVAVMPEVEDIEVTIDPEELKVDVYRSTGPGGQSVNTTDSAVRITHIPTGIVVQCQDEKSQHKNKAKAMKVLRARVYSQLKQERDAARSEQRRNQIGTGDRSERIRTYNYPQGRITDHRIGLSIYKLQFVLEGNLDDLIENLLLHL
jgi:peptide chain release factor 1